jgi:hypothetical protein
MSLSDERKAENEGFFRELNERLERNALDREPGSRRGFQAVCECSLEECTVRLPVSFAEYERVRAESRHFIVARGHTDQRVETILRSLAGCDVVEKLGSAGQVAQRLDPRGHDE